MVQTAIVLLASNIAIAEVAKTGSLYFAVGAAYIAIAALLGVTLARLFFISGTDRTLITSGIAICGGTAIKVQWRRSSALKSRNCLRARDCFC